MPEEMEQRLTNIEVKLDSVETRLGAVETSNRRIASEVARLGAKFDSMELRMATKDDISLILQRFDSFIPSFEAADRDRQMASDAYMRQERRLDDHEARLRKLEEPKS